VLRRRRAAGLSLQ